MISVCSAVSDSSTAPRTDCSASRFCGGVTGPSRQARSGGVAVAVGCGRGAHEAAESRSRVGPNVRSAWNVRRFVREREGPPEAAVRYAAARCGARYFCSTTMVLTVAVTPVGDLDDDHAGADGLDRLVEVDVAAVDRDAARLLDGVGDVLRGDRAEQAAVLAGLVGDREDRLVEQRGVLLRRCAGVGDRALGAPRGAWRRRSRRGWPARRACAGSGSCAGSPWRRRRPCPCSPSVLDVLEQDGLRHR